MTKPKNLVDLANMTASASATVDAMKAYRNSPALSATQAFETSAALKAALGLNASSQALRSLTESPLAEAMRRSQELAAMHSPLAGRGSLLDPASNLLQRTQELTGPLSPLASFRAAHELAGASMLERMAGLHSVYERLPLSTIGSLSLRDRYQHVPPSSLLQAFELSSHLAAVSRATVWADELIGNASRFSSLMSGPLAELERVRQAAATMSTLSPSLDPHYAAAGYSSATSLALGLDTTRFKLSAFAGAGDVLGFHAATSFSAYESVFGEWHTRPDLPARFWWEPQTRHRHYQEAEVDQGLIEAKPAAAIEIVVESGLVAGIADGTSSVALLTVGDLTMQIRASRHRVDIYKVLTAFEQELRRCITMKLKALVGTKWFKQRVDGPMLAKAKEGRRAGLMNGETEGELIAYLDLGDLLAIITRKDNWEQVFEAVFANRERFKFDMQALIAARRPTMHARPLDSVRLVELVCIIRRLISWIEGDGRWKEIADADE